MSKILFVLLSGIVIFLAIQLPQKQAINETQYVPINQIEIADSEIVEYIIEKSSIISTLQSKAQIVSIQQGIHKEYIIKDKKWNGERATSINVHGIFKMGLTIDDIDTDSIMIIDNVIYMQLPDPVLISLELPYDVIDIEKERGFFRKEIDKDEFKIIYKSIRDNLINKVTTNSEILNQAKLNNQDVVKNLLMDIVGVENVVYR